MTIHYTIAITQPERHIIDVSVTLEKPDPAGQTLSLPNWIPGSYMIRDFSRNIVSIRGESGGNPVELLKSDKSSWHAPAGLTDLQVHYRVYAWELSVRAAHVDTNHAFFNGTSVFLCAEGQEDSAVTLSLQQPSFTAATDWQVATGMSADDVNANGFGRYRADDYDELIDHPFEIGSFKRIEFESGGVPHEIVITGNCQFDEARVKRDVKRICDYQIEFFGLPAPMDKYVFQVMVVDSGYGGLEHRASTALLITRENLPVPGVEQIADSYLDFLGLCSHEYFHTWNVKRIKPAAFVPYQLREESYTGLLWFFEGITSYYDDLVLVRCGLIDHQRYLKLLSKTITRVQRGAGRLGQTVTESSFDAWHKFYKQDENSPNAIVSYYAKGALVALCLDARLREVTEQRVSLNDLMKTLWSAWLDGQRGIAEDEPERVAESLAGVSMEEFFETALYSTDELPLVQALASLGVKLHFRARTSASDMGGVVADSSASSSAAAEDQASGLRPWSGMMLRDAADGIAVSNVLIDSPAEHAGFAAGDTIVAIERIAVNGKSPDALLKPYAHRESVSVHYFRLGELHEATLAIAAAPEDTAALTCMDTTLMDNWLGTASAV